MSGCCDICFCCKLGQFGLAVEQLGRSHQLPGDKLIQKKYGGNTFALRQQGEKRNLGFTVEEFLLFCREEKGSSVDSPETEDNIDEDVE